MNEKHSLLDTGVNHALIFPEKPAALEIGIRYVIRYRTSRLAPGTALAAVMGQLTDLPTDGYIRLQMGLAEILNNIATHGATGSPPSCAIEVLGDSKKLCCAVRDDGRAAPLVFYLHRPREPDWVSLPDPCFLPENGFGRHLIHACFDRISYHTTEIGNVLIMEIDFMNLTRQRRVEV